MDKPFTETGPVMDFIGVTSQFCSLIDERDQIKDMELLGRAYGLLPQLCLHASRLPAIDGCELFKEATPHSQWQTLRESLRTKLAEYDAYLEVLDPYDFEGGEPERGSLSEDLADIYEEIVPGLRQWEQADSDKRRGVVAAWKLDYEIHWGEHATGAFRAIHFALFM